jgi:N-acetylated-alpha-linked acidic dipeptidase
MNHFGDPGYKYHAMMTQLWGVLALRLANANVLPYDFEACGKNIRSFVDELDVKSRVHDHLDLKTLYARIDDFEGAGRALNTAIGAALSANAAAPLENSATNRVNSELMQIERNWCNPDGIPGRPWFKHTLYAARFTYAHLELPGLTEAAEAGDWKRAADQEKILESELAKNIALLQQARRDLQASTDRGAH